MRDTFAQLFMNISLNLYFAHPFINSQVFKEQLNHILGAFNVLIIAQNVKVKRFIFESFWHRPKECSVYLKVKQVNGPGWLGWHGK